MHEVEKRALISKEKLQQLQQNLNESGQLLKEFKRFSMIKSNNADFTPDEDDKLDLRLRSVGNESELVLKYGNWHSSTSREEYEVNFETKEFKNMARIVSLLGYKHFIVTYLSRMKYKASGLTIVLDEFYSSKYCKIEVERVVANESEIGQVEEEIDKFLKEMNIEPVTPERFKAYIREINSNKDFQIDFTKQSVDEWYNRWEDYIFCKV